MSHTHNSHSHKFAIAVCIALEIIVVILYGVFVRWGPESDYRNSAAGDEESTQYLQTYYAIFQDVHVMMFIGFGFLMTYLRDHSWTSVSVNFLVAAFAFQIYILFGGFWERVFGHHSWDHYIEPVTKTFITADYGAACVLITFGGIIGKVNPYQMIIIAFFEVFFYSLNEAIVYLELKMFDAGGSAVIHSFGAYFGLACTYVVTTKQAKDHPKNTSHYNSNIFAMIGTLFLWMFWPSFNSALTTGGNAMMRAQMTTIFALVGSCFATFMITAFYQRGKFHMEDILNATLAGGVMIGAAADLCQYPFAAFIVGWIGGTVSTIGFNSIGPKLAKSIGLYDTAGIHNLHGMPGILGGLASAIFAAAMSENKLGTPVEEYFNGRGPYRQGAFQIAGTFCSLGIAILSGLFTGFVAKMKIWNPPRKLFDDREFWHFEFDEEQPILPRPSTQGDRYSHVELSERKGQSPSEPNQPTEGPLVTEGAKM